MYTCLYHFSVYLISLCDHTRIVYCCQATQTQLHLSSSFVYPDSSNDYKKEMNLAKR